jgi:hypothetical protein
MEITHLLDLDLCGKEVHYKLHKHIICSVRQGGRSCCKTSPMDQWELIATYGKIKSQVRNGSHMEIGQGGFRSEMRFVDMTTAWKYRIYCVLIFVEKRFHTSSTKHHMFSVARENIML